MQTKDREKWVSARVNAFARRRGLTHKQLANAIGVTEQQVYKYLNGINRISAGKLFLMATELGVTVDELLVEQELTHHHLVDEFVGNAALIKNDQQRNAICQLAESMTQHRRRKPKEGPAVVDTPILIGFDDLVAAE